MSKILYDVDYNGNELNNAIVNPLNNSATSTLGVETSPVNGSSNLITSGGVYNAINGVLPSQTGNSGKYLTTNGTAASWATVESGDSLPDQTGQSGKYLTTDGTDASWGTVTVPTPSSTTPIVDGTADTGSETTFARGDHVHPTDTSRAPLASPTFTGTPTAPTPTSGSGDTQIATKKYVDDSVSSAGGGTVVSVRVQATSPVLSSQNTAQTSTLNTTISLDDAYGDTKNPYGSKTANQVLAAPNGSAGNPSFRSLVAADIPSITKSKISDFPTEMTPTSHTHGNITNGGDITSNVSIASGDRLVINDESTGKIDNSSITFGTSETTFLSNKGTWATPENTTYTFDGAYDASTNKAATVSTVTNAINALDGGTIGTGSTSKTITSLSQTNGNVSAAFENIAFPVTSVNTKTGAVSLSASDVSAQPTITASGILKGDGTGTITAAVAGTDYQAPLPSQTGNSGKFLTTDGTDTSWASVSSGGSTVSVTQSLSSGTKVGTITVDGNATDLYAPTNTDVNVTQTKGTYSSYTNWRGVTVGASSASSATSALSTTTGVEYAFDNLKFQPSTGTLRTRIYNVAPTAAGTTASNNQMASDSTNNIYFKVNNGADTVMTLYSNGTDMQVRPGGNYDDQVDLGKSTVRWKDLYLSGTIYNSPASTTVASGDKILVNDTSAGTIAGGISLGTSTTQYLANDGSWQTVPTGLPSQSGNSGKYLTTDGSSASWATVSGGTPDIFWVTITATTSGNTTTYSADKTFAQITAAVTAGQVPIVKYEETFYQLVTSDSFACVFVCAGYSNGDFYNGALQTPPRGNLHKFYVDNTDAWEKTYFELADVFIAIPDDTLHSEIADAYNAGKMIFCTDPVRGVHSYNCNLYVPLTKKRNNSDGLEFIFSCINNEYVHSIEVNSSDTWSYSDITFAPINSPAFTGTPTAPTATAGTNTTQIATTAFVQSAISGINTSPNTANVTLQSSSWNSSTLQCTVTVTGITASSIILVTPQANSTIGTQMYDLVAQFGVICTDWGTNSLTFTCKKVPTSNISMHAMWW